MNIITSNTEDFQLSRSRASRARTSTRQLASSEKVPHYISDRLINIFRNTLVEEFNSTFKTMKDNICIEN